MDTGRAPNGVTIDQPFALGFIYNIVPPPTVDTMAKCPDGVATVETQQLVLNWLVSAITVGIVTPMQVNVACAGGTADAGSSPSEDLVQLSVGEGGAVAAAAKAADAAAATGAPVAVRFQ